MSNRRHFLRSVAATTAVIAGPSAFAAKAFPREGDRPNIMFVMSDDHAAHAIGAYGSRLAALNPTPVIDTLARDGMRFTNAYCTNAICTPSRACIMTGQYSHVNGVLTLGGKLPPEQQFLAIEMRKAGYLTAMVGKWHLKEEPNFDYYKVLPGQGSYFNPTFKDKTAGDWPDNVVKTEGHSSDRIADISLKWLRERDRSKPFFLMHHFKAPHDMFQYAPRYESYLADINIPEPKTLWEQPNFGSIATRGHNDELLPHIGTSIGRRNPRRNYTKKWAQDPTLTDEQAKRQAYNGYLKAYLRCVKGVDDNLKRVLDLLEESGDLDNTVIIYTGDQGFMLGEHDYMDKRWMYDESQRMPFIVRYPKTVKPGVSDAIVENVDYGPLMLDFAGVKTPDDMQGRSFRSICETGKEPRNWKKAAYYRYWMHMASHDNPGHLGIRTKTHKLIFYYGCGMSGENQTPPGWELYDLKRDPTEVNNVYDNPEYAKTAKDLKKQLADLRESIGDDDADYPEMKKVIEEFWDYDEEARKKAEQISHNYKAKKERGRSSSSSKTSSSSNSKAVTKPGEHIKTAPSEAPLRELEGAKEISREATYYINKPGPASYNPDNAYLLSGDAPQAKQHAFHCPNDANKPHIVVCFDKARSVSAIEIINRKGQLIVRAAGLTIWTSSDEKKWKQVWQASTIEQKWLVDLGKGVDCKFIKIGLERKGTLHLNKVTVFGK